MNQPPLRSTQRLRVKEKKKKNFFHKAQQRKGSKENLLKALKEKTSRET